MFNFSFLLNPQNLALLGRGLLMTLVLSLLAVIFGGILSLIPAFMRLSNNKIFRAISRVYVEVIRGTPMLVQILLVYELLKIPLVMVMGVDMGSFIPGIIALVINCSAYISEIVRGGIIAVDKGQTEAARSLGMSSAATMGRVILPQAVKIILPSLGNEFVVIIKETSIFMYLGVAELMFQIGIIKAQTYIVRETYIVAGLMYLCLTVPLSYLMKYLERRMHVDAK